MPKGKEKGIYADMKCHHWSGDLLIKEKGCRHKFRKGIFARTLDRGAPSIFPINLVEKAVKEANLLQWVEYEILKYAVGDTKNVMDVAEKIIKRVRENG